MDRYYQEGCEAFWKWIENDCKGSTENPYPEDIDANESWQYGWDDQSDYYNHGQYEE